MSRAASPIRRQDAWSTPENARRLAAYVALKNEEIAERLRDLRKQAGGPTQEIVAEELGVGHRTLGTWEQAEARPSYRNLTKLANFYGVTVRYILDGGDAPPALDESSQLDRIEAMLTEVVSRLETLEAAVTD